MSFRTFVIYYHLLLLIFPGIVLAENPEFDEGESTVLITGANRGLGLEFARQYAQSGWNVIASCRRPNDAYELQKLAGTYDKIAIEQLDVTNDRQVADLKNKYSQQPIDVLLNKRWNLWDFRKTNARQF